MVDAVRVVPRTDDPSYVSTIIGLCRNEQVAAVLPLIDPEISVLGVTAKAASASFGPDGAEMVSDTWLTCLWLSEDGIPTARTWLPGDDGRQENELPVFMKPQRGGCGVDGPLVMQEAKVEAAGLRNRGIEVVCTNPTLGGKSIWKLSPAALVEVLRRLGTEPARAMYIP